MDTERDFEKEATSQGWNSEGKLDAEAFVKKGEEILPIVNANNRKLKTQVEELTQKVSSLEQGNAEFKQFSSKAIEQAQRERNDAIVDLEAVRQKAIDNDDLKSFAAAEKKINKIRAEPQQAPVDNAYQAEWVSDNPWYDQSSAEYNRDKAIWANGASDLLRVEKPYLKDRAFLDELGRLAGEKYSDENPARQRSTVEDTTASKPTKAGGFDDLPDEAKYAYETFKEMMPEYTKEEYFDTYQLGEK